MPRTYGAVEYVNKPVVLALKRLSDFLFFSELKDDAIRVSQFAFNRDLQLNYRTHP